MKLFALLLVFSLGLAGCVADAQQHRQAAPAQNTDIKESAPQPQTEVGGMQLEKNITGAAEKPKLAETKNDSGKSIGEIHGPAYPYANISTVKTVGNAKVVMEEFVSFSCAVCNTARAAVAKAVSDGTVALRLRHFPLPQTPGAYLAAQAFECAADEGKEWEIVPALYAHPENHTQGGLLAMAKDAGIDGANFTWCMESGAKKSLVNADLARVKELGIRGTPYFIIGNNTIPHWLPAEDFLPKVADYARAAGPA